MYSTDLADWARNILMRETISMEKRRFGLVSLFNGISTFVGYLTPKPFS